jgi:predicted GNAT family acetyltransferase
MDQAENGLLCGTLISLKTQPLAKPSFMAEVKRNGETVGAAFYSEINLIVTRDLGAAMRNLSDSIKARHLDLPGVVGPAETAESFADEWARVRGCGHFLAMDQGLYRLTEIQSTEEVAGNMRAMTASDIDVVAKWIHAFYVEVLPNDVHGIEQSRKNAQARVEGGMTFLWQVGERSVAMASLARQTTRGISINAVYTPPEERRRGYATALVAAVSREGLRRGKEFCVLYTDLANPTSNSIYQKIGYRFIARSRNYRFVYGP